MSNKLMYVTKKKVNQFIDRKKRDPKMSDEKLLSEVNETLAYLNEFPESNPNQIKFFTRIAKALQKV